MARSCPTCDCVLDVERPFCPSCGGTLGAPERRTSSRPPPRAHSSTLFSATLPTLRSLGDVLLVLLSFGTAWFWFAGRASRSLVKVTRRELSLVDGATMTAVPLTPETVVERATTWFDRLVGASSLRVQTGAAMVVVRGVAANLRELETALRAAST